MADFSTANCITFIPIAMSIAVLNVKKNEENWISKGSMAKNPLAILLRTREQKKGSNLKKNLNFFI